MPALNASSGKSLSELLRGVCDISAAVDRRVAGVAIDSHNVVRDGLFMACCGRDHHGLEFAPSAVERGASSVVWERHGSVDANLPAAVASVPVAELSRHASAIAARFYDDPSHALNVIGVTGTNGKSTTVHLLTQALETLAAPAASIGTLGASSRQCLHNTGGLTTPNPAAVQRLLAQFRDDDIRTVAMEASSHGLDQYRLEAVRFRVAVFTNLGRDHLDYHGSQQAYAEAKARLFTWSGLHAAVINLDDPFSRVLVDRIAKDVIVIGYSMDAALSRPPGVTRLLQAQELQISSSATAFMLRHEAGASPVTYPLVGRFNVSNVLAALGTLIALGYSCDAAARSLVAVRAAPARMEQFGGAGRARVVVDFAHTPQALENVLTAAREHASGRVLVVFGCGGERDRGKRAQMACVAAAHADMIWVTDDNPRKENPDAIVADIVAGFPAHTNRTIERDRRRAIAAALREAQPDDVVVVAGKGHETAQIVGTDRRPFDDRKVVRELLEVR